MPCQSLAQTLQTTDGRADREDLSRCCETSRAKQRGYAVRRRFVPSCATVSWLFVSRRCARRVSFLTVLRPVRLVFVSVNGRGGRGGKPGLRDVHTDEPNEPGFERG